MASIRSGIQLKKEIKKNLLPEKFKVHGKTHVHKLIENLYELT
jgi:hypothetical protein